MTAPWPPMPAEQRADRAAGPLLDQWQVSQGVGRCLHHRLVPWLDEVARQQGDPVAVQRPQWIGVWDGDTKQFEQHAPRVLVACRETSGTPDYRSDGEVWVPFRVQVGAIVLATDDATPDRLASIYGAAIAACVANHAVDHLEQIDRAEWVRGMTGINPQAPDGIVGHTTQEFDVLAGPIFHIDGRLSPLPFPEAPPVEPDDQGDSPVVIHTNLEVAPVTGENG